MAVPEPQGAAKAARHPLVERILTGSAPDPIRLAAARGSLPLPLQDLVYAQICLRNDASPAVVQAATESLAALTGDALLPIVRDPACDPIVLDYLARSGRLQGDSLAAAIAHPAIMDGTLEAVASSAPAETLNLIVTNEVRLIRTPRLLEVLRANPNLSGDSRRRLSELERDFIGKEVLKVRTEIPATQTPAGAIPEVPAEAEAPPADETAAAPTVMTEEEERNFEEQLKKT